MTFLPIVERELRVAARRKVTFRVRFASAVTAALVGGLFLVGTLAPGSTPGSPGSGAAPFHFLVVASFCFALFTGGFLTADCLSREKREGTLGFLFLTDLNGFDVVAGKFSALGLVPLHGLLAIFPVAAMTVFMGGVTGEEFWRLILVVLNTLFLSLAVGLWISSVVSDERQAIGLTLGAMLVVTAVPEILGWLARIVPRAAPFEGVRLASPSALLRLGFETLASGSPRGFGWGLLYQHALAWLALIVAAAMVRHAWRRGGVVGQVRGGGANAPASREEGNGTSGTRQRIIAAHRERLKAAGPIAWISWQGSWIRRAAWWVTAFTILATLASGFSGGRWTGLLAGPSFLASAPVTLGFYALKLLMAIHVIYFLQDACRSGMMELVLTTPLSSHQFASGHLAALRHMFVWPIVVLGSLQILTGFTAWLANTSDWPSLPKLVLFGLLPSTLGVCVHGLDFLAVAYHASHKALRYDRPAKALAHTTLLVLLLPGVFCGPARLIVDLVIIGQLSREIDRMRELVRGWYFSSPAERMYGAPRTG